MASNGLITDLYQLTMTNALFKKGMHERKVVFDRFYRVNPFKGGYTVVAGLSHLVDFVKNFTYSDEDIEYLRSLHIFYPEFLDYLSHFHFTGNIYGMPEGTVAFPGELLLRFEGTTTEAMLLETGLSMIMNHESLIATKCRRVRTVAPKDALMEFGLRRAQGHSAGLWGARASMIGGFNGTSNVEAGKLFGIPVLGTMAHSWVMSFDTELEAFEEYVKQYHDNLILLADTYNVLEMGVPHAIQVFRELKAAGKLPKKYGIRIDSGDLGYLSQEASRMFREAGFPDAIISGSKMSAREKDGTFEPVMKISNDVSKMTNPGIKAVRRFYKKGTGKMITDLVCLADEPFPDGGDFTLVTESAKWRKKELKAGTYTCEDMLKPVILQGKAVKLPSLDETIAYANRQMETLWPEYTRLLNPNIMEVNLSDKLQELKSHIIDEDLKKK
mgnify:CR=1 FL=1